LAVQVFLLLLLPFTFFLLPLKRIFNVELRTWRIGCSGFSSLTFTFLLFPFTFKAHLQRRTLNFEPVSSPAPDFMLP